MPKAAAKSAAAPPKRHVIGDQQQRAAAGNPSTQRLNLVCAKGRRRWQSPIAILVPIGRRVRDDLAARRQSRVPVTKNSPQRRPSRIVGRHCPGRMVGVNFFQEPRLQDVTESRPTNWFWRHKRGILRLGPERQLLVSHTTHGCDHSRVVGKGISRLSSRLTRPASRFDS